MKIFNDKIELYDPGKPLVIPFLTLQPDDVYTQENETDLHEQMRTIAKQTFLILEKAWQILGRTLVDFKVEFGIDSDGTLLLSDVIDNDSWRLLEKGQYIDKQVYRDGGDLNEVTKKYAHVSALTEHFHLPKSKIILWAGSEKDDLSELRASIVNICNGQSAVEIGEIRCSAHKEPVKAMHLLHTEVQKNPNAVIIAFIGMSNGAGPTLSGATTVPVITVPANYKNFPDDVWSSLRTPSYVSVMTVLNPENAVLAALNILSARSPQIYMILQEQVEKRLVNCIMI